MISKTDKLIRALAYADRRLYRATTARHWVLWLGRRDRITWLLVLQRQAELRLKADGGIHDKQG
jgi:hypothetical protein